MAELAEHENRVFLMPFSQSGQPVGYVQLLLKNADNDPELADGQEVAHVHDLRTRMEFQSNGIGRQLMSALEDEARARGVKRVTLGVDNWNERAIRFYKSLGYSRFKEAPGRTDSEVCYFLLKELI